MKSDADNKFEAIIICPLCNKPNDASSLSCAFCSADFNAMTVCPKCFDEQSVKRNICSKCSHPLKKNIKFYSKRPPKSSAFFERNEENPIGLIVLLIIPLAAFFLLMRIRRPEAQFPALALMIVSTFLLVKRAYRRRDWPACFIRFIVLHLLRCASNQAPPLLWRGKRGTCPASAGSNHTPASLILASLASSAH